MELEQVQPPGRLVEGGAERSEPLPDVVQVGPGGVGGPRRGQGILHPLQRRDGVERDDVRASAATANGAAFRGITIALD